MIAIMNDDGTYFGEFFSTLAEAETRIGELEKEIGGSFQTKVTARKDG